MELFNYRKSYTKDKLSINDIGDNPIDFFVKWFKEAENSDQIIEPNAMTISTVDENYSPSSRVVLLKQIKERSLIFFTNYNSNKAVSIDQNNKVSISFFWEDFERQVIIKGIATKTTDDFSTKYFNSRPKGSKLGALVSENQSSIIKSKDYIVKKFNELSKEYLNKEISRPDNWGGYIIKPIQYEFWQGGENRLHDRIRYTLDKNIWQIDRLSP